MVGVAVPQGAGVPSNQLENWRKQHGLTYPLVNDAKGDVSSRFGVSAIPIAMVIDRTGKLIGSSDNVNGVLKLIRPLLSSTKKTAKR